MTDQAPPQLGNIQPTTIEEEMRSSFIDYAMSVIVSRALPNVRDGLKPVHRRILYAMHQLKNFHNQPYKKSARIVGDVIGKYHPHGDSAVYDALVRMAQDFSLRYPLADGQGNFGSIDGDPAAAMRYTEIRMAAIGSAMLADIEMETVDWQPNYDDKELEPQILPAQIPNLLVNGAQGIAVGMATNIPPHNIHETINAAIALVRNPEIGLPELMEIIPGPDFPTAGFIYGRQGIAQAYQTGRGQVMMRARTEIEEFKKNRQAIIVTELPYQVNKARLVEKMAALVREKRLEGISDLRDESSRQGMRIVIELKRDAVPEILLNQLYKLTQLQESFNINMVAIVDGRPEILCLKDVLQKYVDHRVDVVTRRTAFQLREAEKRAHILEGLKIALDNLDEVIALIRKAESPAAAKTGLCERFSLSPIQAQAILDMRLQRLTALERDKIIAELKEIQEKIAFYKSLLADAAKMLEVVIAEMEEVREKYNDERRTEIIDASGEISVEDLIADEEMIVTITHSGYVKREAISAYRAQKRGGKGVTGMTTRDEDWVRDLFIASTHDMLLMFTDAGRVYCRPVYEIPRASRSGRGKAIVNLIDLRPGERVQQVLTIKEIDDAHFVVMATRNGLIKRTRLQDFSNIRSTGIIAIDIEEGDELTGVRVTDGNGQIMLTTAGGNAIRFDESQVRAMGRTARGVRGITVQDGDRVVAMSVLEKDSDSTVLTVCERGYGKRTLAEEFGTQNRGGKGLIAIKTTERNGQVVDARVLDDKDQVMVITDVGKVIRMTTDGIPVIGRNTQGVRLIRLAENESVVAVERLAERDDDEHGDEHGDEPAAISAEEMIQEAAAEDPIGDTVESDSEKPADDSE
ncbi:MAG: DNA gyrase subunit A [Deltaproteobacteria bacterium]|nr:DNA gyrase subunit A [Deltaproteobacteria bacterium]